MVVFPTVGAQVWELAADHLDRLPGKSLVDRLVKKSSVAQDDHAAGANKEHHRAENTRDESDGNGNDPEAGVELDGRPAVLAELEVAALHLADEVHASRDEYDIEE